VQTSRASCQLPSEYSGAMMKGLHAQHCTVLSVWLANKRRDRSKAQPKPDRQRNQTCLPARQGHACQSLSPLVSCLVCLACLCRSTSVWEPPPGASSLSSSSAEKKKRLHRHAVRPRSLANQSTAEMCGQPISSLCRP